MLFKFFYYNFEANKFKNYKVNLDFNQIKKL